MSSGTVAVRFNLVTAFKLAFRLFRVHSLLEKFAQVSFSEIVVQTFKQTNGKALLKVSWRSLRRCMSMLVFSWSAFLRIYMAATFSLVFLLNLFSLLSAFKSIAITLKPLTTYSLGQNCWENCILGQHFSKNRSCTGSSLSPFPWKQCCCVFKRKPDPWAFVGSNIESGEGVFFPQRRRFGNSFVAERKVDMMGEPFSSSFVRDCS